MFKKIMPELPCSDVSAAVAYYRDTLGFTVNYEQADLGVMDRDAVRVLLVARTKGRTGNASAYIYVDDADALHAECVAKGVAVSGVPVSREWGLRDFCMTDLDGNTITYGQPLW